MSVTNVGDFSSPYAALELPAHAGAMSIAEDLLKYNYTYTVRVLTSPLPYTPHGTTVQGFKFQGRILELTETATGTMGPPSPHRPYRDPCSLIKALASTNDEREKKKLAARITQLNRLHTEFRAGIGVSSGQRPAVGDEVLVTLKPGTFGLNLKQADMSTLVLKSGTIPISDPQDCLPGLQDLFGDGSASLGASGNATESLWPSLVASVSPALSMDNLSSDRWVEGSPVDVSAVVESERIIWNEKKETHTDVYSVLKKYWDNINVDQWTPTDNAWSAAFISWVMNQVDPSFPGSYAHYYYAKSAAAGVGGWTAWPLGGYPRIKAQLGDILIKDMTHTSEYSHSGHGDVLYAFDFTQTTAYLAGGNLSNTMSINAAGTRSPITIDKDGFYKDVGSYVIVLKKGATLRSADYFATNMDITGGGSSLLTTTNEDEEAFGYLLRPDSLYPGISID